MYTYVIELSVLCIVYVRQLVCKRNRPLFVVTMSTQFVEYTYIQCYSFLTAFWTPFIWPSLNYVLKNTFKFCYRNFTNQRFDFNFTTGFFSQSLINMKIDYFLTNETRIDLVIWKDTHTHRHRKQYKWRQLNKFQNN